MATVTLQVLEGLERGRVFSSLETPVSIGREISNTVALNDESISRYHAKIQDDQGRLILTDLSSTNGTRVNGHPVQLKVLQPGDQIHVGRCILVFGSRNEIEQSLGLKLSARSGDDLELGKTTPGPFRLSDDEDDAQSLESDTDNFGLELFPRGCPELPSGMSLVQRAQVSDLLSFLHNRLAMLMTSAIEHDDGVDREVAIPWVAWQKIIQTEMELAKALQEITEPE